MLLAKGPVGCVVGCLKSHLGLRGEFSIAKQASISIAMDEDMCACGRVT